MRFTVVKDLMQLRLGQHTHAHILVYTVSHIAESGTFVGVKLLVVWIMQGVNFGRGTQTPKTKNPFPVTVHSPTSR